VRLPAFRATPGAICSPALRLQRRLHPAGPPNL
jgi:hypothetical protein